MHQEKMTYRYCVNQEHRNQKEIEVMRRMKVDKMDIDRQIEWAERYSPKARQYVCGNCPSYGLCSFRQKYPNYTLN